MPWKDQSIVRSRVQFIEDHATGLLSMSELCRSYGISRTTGYKWLERFRAGQPLSDRSRTPRRCPHRTSEALERAIVAERRKHPRWGPDKIRAVLLRREPDEPWPSSTTMGAILERHGLTQPRRRRRRPGPDRPITPIEPSEPNEVWSTDFKGEFRMGDRRYCYPLTVADVHSRYIVGCTALTCTGCDPAWAAFERLFAEYGLPWAIVSDNGTPFASGGLAGLTRLSVWWIRLGVLPVTIQPGRPQQNGKHERMHRTLKAHTTRPPGADLADQQLRFDRFRQEYNHDRPHAALDQRPPAELYRPSPRPMPAKLAAPDYPGHYEVRRVRAKGAIKWAGGERFVSQALAGEWIGLEEIDEGAWSVYLDRFLIARLHGPTGQIVSARPACRWPAPLALRARSAAQRQAQECQPCSL